MKPRIFIGTLLLISTCGVYAGAADLAENWPQWRGPLGTSVGADGEYPVDFDAEKGQVWKIDLPGTGSSTPAVWGDQIFVTTPIDDRDGIVCYGMDGKEQWRHQFGEQRKGRHRNGSGSNPSPTTDGQHLVVYFKSGTLACFDLKGKLQWNTNLQEKYGKDVLWWDLGTSPVLYGNSVIVAVVHGGESFLVALDLDRGEALWRERRQYKCSPESDQTYSTPQVVKIDDRDVVVTWGADHLTGHDAATGKLLWECGGFNPQNKGQWRTIASVAIGDGIAVVPYGRTEFLAGIKLGGEGDITESARLWEKRGIGSDCPTPIFKNGRVYLLSDKGRIVSVDPKTGELFWSANFPKNRNSFFSSPVLAGAKFYAAREDGMLFVGQVSDDGFKELAHNDMGESIIATPVPIRGKLLVRGADHLFLLDGATKD